MPFHIPCPDEELRQVLQHEIDCKTKPLQSLGRLESLALQIGLVQQTVKPTIRRPTLLVFAADHGLGSQGVSPYPQSVTGAMVRNFAEGGAAINVLTRELGWNLQVINAGTLEPTPWPGVLDRRIAPGTRNMLETAAMTEGEMRQALDCGVELIRELAGQGCNTVGLGEMGIGNSSAAALLIHCLAGIPLTEAVSRGAGCDDKQWQHKKDLLAAVLQKHGPRSNPWEALQIFGGFELAMLVGAALAAAEQRMLIVVDGLIASAAILVAVKAYPAIQPYLIFAHQSAAQGHAALLQELGVKALLDLGLRLGEGSGAALALPLLRSAAALLTDMATFASAAVEGPVQA